MTDNDSKSYLPYLNKLEDQTRILIIILLIQNVSLLITLLSLKKLRPILKHLNLNKIIELELQSIKMFLVKVTLKIGQERY